MAQAAFNGLHSDMERNNLLLHENIPGVKQLTWLSGWLFHADY
jgi:hypothetical protein